MSRFIIYAMLAVFLPVAVARAQSAPGYGYATDDANRIVSVNLYSGDTAVYSGQTIFGANALGYSGTNGAAGSVIYASSASSGATYGELAVWNCFANTHTDIGNLFGTYSGTASPVTAGTGISDAAYWDGSSGPPAGYYIVGSNHNIYRVTFNVDGSAYLNINSIAKVTLAGTIPYTIVTKNFSFGDIAFNPVDGTLYLSDSANGLASYNFTSGLTQVISTRYEGQIAFGQDSLLYGVGNLSGTASTQGNGLYQISLTTGAVTSIAANTDPGHYYTDFSGASGVYIVPEPGALALTGLAASMLVLCSRWRAACRVDAHATRSS